jgi:hypothetical protein
MLRIKEQKLRPAMKHKGLSITSALPGWIRYQNINDLRTIDFNPKDPVHRALLQTYAARRDWRQVATPCPADVDSMQQG